MARIGYSVFVDESGVRAHGPKTSEHFVMAACILPDAQRPDLLAALAQLRVDLRQPPQHTIQFKDLAHQSRVHVAKTLGALPYLTITSVVVGKRQVSRPIHDVDGAYLYTLRYLLERVSWYVDDQGGCARVTFAHIDRFKISKLYAYIAALLGSDTQIRWPALHQPVHMVTMRGHDFLQVADSAASAVAQAFEPDQFGNTERGYLDALRPRLYRHPPGLITSYGMKLHPAEMVKETRYSWVAAL